jgi:eukaryotic-like serine/threonine-protein kinase
MVPTRLIEALSDRYRIERELGAGGMATVYLAQDLKHDRQVAIKVLRPELAAVIGAERFLSEIKTTANLQHPHILPLHDSGEADGFLFYVMPFVEGETVRDRINREKQLPVADAVRIAIEVAGALDYAHRHNVIHRDIKPENILLHDGRALVADFGIALAASKAGGTRMTETGMSLGTPHYMSPEQAMGEREITARSDVYALGCVLYEMLMGEPPFTGPTAQAIIAKVMTDAPHAMTLHRNTVPPQVEAAVLQALQKLPADRFGTAAEFAAALTSTTYTRPMTGIGYAPSAAAGRWRSVALGAVALAVVAIAFGAWAWRHQQPSPTVRLSVAFPAGEKIRSVPTRRFALAPDGSRMVYVGPDSAAGDQLWVRELNSLTGRPLPGTSGAVAPFFSPDGRSVAYFTGNPGDVRVVSIAGGPSLTVVRDSATPWGGDWDEGGMIYFTHARSVAARVPASGGAVQIVSRLDSASGVTEHDWVQALPGGKHALVQIWHSSIANAELGILDLATGIAVPIIQAAYGQYIPSGHIVFVTVSGSLMSVPFSVSGRKLTGAPVAIAEQVRVDASSGSGQFSVSDNGLLAYISGGGSGSGQVVWVDRTGRQTPVDTAWRGQFDAVALSPDDSRLAVSVLGSDGSQTWVKPLPAGPVSRLTFGTSGNERPAWTPDGRSVAFISAPGGAARTGRIQRADGSADAELLATDPRGVEEVEWAPDGRRFVLRLGGTSGARNLVLATLGDSVRRPLVSGPADEFAPAISPDGRWFAYCTNESGRSEVFVRLLDDPGAGRTQVSLNGGQEPRWARSGKELFYRTRSGEIMAAEVTLGATFSARPPRALFVAPNMATDPFHHAYAVGRDGRFLMINQSANENGELVMVFNWFDELRGRK